MDKNDLLQFAQMYIDNLEDGLLKENDSKYLMCFSPIRQNVIALRTIADTAKVLEIGGTSCMTTRFLCSRASSVLTVETDEMYSEVNQYVNNYFSNLTIKNSLQEAFDDKYNIIVMIGTTDEINRYECVGETVREKVCWLLQQATNALLPDGEIWLSFTNFHGIDRIAEGRIDFSTRELYTKQEMQTLIQKLGFDVHVYYPIPDYRFAYEVYSENYMPQGVSMNVPKFDSDRVTMFDEVAALDEACKQGMYDQFANAYLFVCKLKNS